jgi:flavin reductase (DIM6/NTAB) family NADH-FMN oxidoreductase RutF
MDNMKIEFADLTAVQKQNYLQYAVAPRPVCFASTVDKEGNINLSPFSFFNVFSTDPPILIFSPSRRVRNNTTKHTLQNILEVPEVVINIVDYNMVQQVSLASCEYAKGVNEFIKAGFTEERSSLVHPPMVKESKIQFECKVNEVKALGSTGGSGNLVICEVLVMHINDEILDESGMIDQQKIHHIARMGGDWYSRVDNNNLFKVQKPTVHIGIGIDALPQSIRNSQYLTGNDLGKLALVESVPDIDPTFDDNQLRQIVQYYSINPEEMEKEIHLYAHELLESGKVIEAWQVLLTV